MTELSEAAKAAAEIFPSVSDERRLECQADLRARRKIAERIIQRLLDENAENERLKNTIFDLEESKEVLLASFELLKIATAKIERLKQQCDVNEDKVNLLEARLVKLADRRNPANDLIAVQKKKIEQLERQLAVFEKEIDLLQEVDAAATSVCSGISEERVPKGIYRRFVDALMAYDSWRDQLAEATNEGQTK